MIRIGVRELRQHASKYLAMVKSGQSVEITDRGELVAVLSPATPAQTGRDRLIADGLLVAGGGTGRARNAQPLPSSPDPTISMTALLDEERSERV